ncbi:neuromedin-U isoform X4 [Lethenteron reissneri]|uniref:neuromedin-U isoform X4 n=1 Tax=Lethenteron reissneri TaxID=7753 RepID=UPI002AB73ABD|nr:neuromedin-U isoform X4 [Lethenteron reissneri]
MKAAVGSVVVIMLFISFCKGGYIHRPCTEFGNNIMKPKVEDKRSGVIHPLLNLVPKLYQQHLRRIQRSGCGNVTKPDVILKLLASKRRITRHIMTDSFLQNTPDRLLQDLHHHKVLTHNPNS